METTGTRYALLSFAFAALVLCLRNLALDETNRELLTRDALQLLAEKLPASDADLNVRPRASGSTNTQTQLQTRPEARSVEAESNSNSQHLWAHSLSQETVAAALATIFAFVELPRAQLETQLQRSLSRSSVRQSRREQPTKASTAAIRCVPDPYVQVYITYRMLKFYANFMQFYAKIRLLNFAINTVVNSLCLIH